MKKLKEYNYFEEFIRNAELIVKSAETLKETLDNYSEENLTKNISTVHGYENEADKRLHEMRNYLIKDFLPPIDREDIVLIGHRIDDVEDCIDEILINFNILNVKTVRPDYVEFANVIIECVGAVKAALGEFENFKKAEQVKEKVIEINRLEEKCDRIYEKSMKKLYSEETDPIEIIKWSNIYSCFENATDSCERVADCIEDVIMKNS